MMTLPARRYLGIASAALLLVLSGCTVPSPIPEKTEHEIRNLESKRDDVHQLAFTVKNSGNPKSAEAKASYDSAKDSLHVFIVGVGKLMTEPPNEQPDHVEKLAGQAGAGMDAFVTTCKKIGVEPKGWAEVGKTVVEVLNGLWSSYTSYREEERRKMVDEINTRLKKLEMKNWADLKGE